MILTQKGPKEKFVEMLKPEKFKYYQEIYEDFLVLKSPFKWDGAYQTYKNIIGQPSKDSGFPDYTNYTDKWRGTIDHIFYTPNT